MHEIEAKIGWSEADISTFVQDQKNTMVWAPRMNWSEFTMEKYIDVVLTQSLPLVVSGPMDSWIDDEKKIFSLDWLRKVL